MEIYFSGGEMLDGSVQKRTRVHSGELGHCMHCLNVFAQCQKQMNMRSPKAL